MLKTPYALPVGVVMLYMTLGGINVVAQGTDVTIVAISRASAGPDDVLAVLPEPQTSFPLLTNFVVEIWAQTLASNGFAQVSVDLDFPPNVFVATSVAHAPLFSLFAVGTIDNANGVVDDISGSVSPVAPACSGRVGASPQWVRVATIEMQAMANGSGQFVIGPTNNPVFVNANCGSIDPPMVTFLGVSVIAGVPVPASSSWGLLAMAMILLAFGTVQIRRIREWTQ